MGILTLASGSFRSLVVVNSLVSTGQANGIRVMLLNVLRDKTNACSRFVLVAELNNVLAVERLTDRLDSFLEVLIREERRGLGGLGGRTRQRTCSHRNVGEELGLLVREAFLLKELIVQGGFTGLLRLLL